MGTRLARMAAVSLCYRRTRRLPTWPYNLFAMVHARSDAELRSALEQFDREDGRLRRRSRPVPADERPPISTVLATGNPGSPAPRIECSGMSRRLSAAE